MIKSETKPEILADETLRSVFQAAFAKHRIKPGQHGWRSVKTFKTVSSKEAVPLLIAWMLENMDEEKTQRVQELQNHPKMYLLFKGGLPARAAVDRVARLNVRDAKRIHFIVSNKESAQKFVARLLLALDRAGEDHLILDAWWEGNTFVVVSPGAAGFKKLRVPLAKLGVLGGYAKEEREKFEIDEDGVFVYWPGLDIHLGWEQFEQAVDRKAALRGKQESEEFNKDYGAAIRELRQESGLRQSDIKGLTARQVGRIERGECRATYKALTKLAKAHQREVAEYMEEVAGRL